ncbi:MAG TPA: M50 family metallopeptidase [Actinomycetota bacterium]|jgi:membrane-associated protease RseP (regulator of RpoE activity)|nr:M50 family metallopeptidase [Actinomycetota bacterium]
MAGTVGEIAFFVALILVILVHEAAHFGVAKRFGFKVDEFFVGFGPRIWSTRRGETEYGVKWIPAGGYVRIAGMNPFEQVRPEDVPRTYGSKPIWQRALVIAAGPSTHFVLAFLLFAIWLGMVGQPSARSPLVAEVAPRLAGHPSPAATAGLRAGDQIVAIDGISHPTDAQLIRFTRRHVGQEIALQVERDGRVLTVHLTPVLSQVGGRQVGRIGVALTGTRETAGPLASITGGGGMVWDSLVGSVKGLGRLFGPEGLGRLGRLLFTNAPRSSSDVQSVVGVGRVVGQAAAGSRFWDILWVFAFVNVFIGFLNLLPLPPFDGGHLAVLAVEKARGRKIDMRKLIPISAAVATLFVLLFVAVVYLDIAKPVG